MKKFSFWTRSLLLLCFIVFCSSNGWAWNTVYLIGQLTGDNWDNYQKKYAFIDDTEDNSKSYYEVSVTPGHTYYFAVYIDHYEHRCGPTTRDADIKQDDKKSDEDYHRANHYYNSWKIIPTTNKIKICSDQSNGHDETPWIWVEEIEIHETKHQINISAGTGGTVLPSGYQQVGETGITITATPSTGYRFKEWTFNGGAHVVNSTSATTTLTATAEGTVTAYFEQSSTPTPTPPNTDYAYYLIGNFMNTDGDNINTSDRKFRFFKKTDGTYYFDVPATLTVKSQIVAVAPNGTSNIYGPTLHPETEFNIINNDSQTYDLGKNSNHFKANNRGFGGYGMYTYTLTVDPTTGAPQSVEVTHNLLKTVAYFWPKATATSPNPTAQPCYSSRNDENSGGDDKYFGSVNLEQNQKCFVIGNMCLDSNNDAHALQYTQTKLYVQGNGGGDVISGGNNGSIDYHKVYPTWANKDRTALADGFTFGGKAGAYLLEYNPSKGSNEVANTNGNDGIGGEVLKGTFGELVTPITSMNIIGTGIPASGSWDISKKQPMTYNQELQCYEYTFTKTTPERTSETFRFVANNDWSMNWEENSTNEADKARVPYNDDTKTGHAATDSDPNYVCKAGANNGERADAETQDIILNRPEGEWTIRFYIVTKPTESGNGYTSEYYYTITESFDIPLTYCKDKFIRTYSNNIPMNLTSGVKAYIAYKFEPAANNEKYGNCKVYLRQMKYIPANVGVVLVGQKPADGNSYSEGAQLKFSLQKRVEAVPNDLCEVWTRYDEEYHTKGDEWHNFLVPTVAAVNNLGNAKTNDDGQIIYRYFGLSSYYNTAYYKSTKTGENYIGFFRLTPNGKSGANRAYLSIPSSAVVGTDGENVSQEDLTTYGCLNFNAQLSGQETDEDGHPQLAKAMVLFDDENSDNDITAIITVNDSIVKDNVYYNLQGVRVATPSKGIYIFNGKKILVK